MPILTRNFYLKYNLLLRLFLNIWRGNDHEVEFQEIERGDLNSFFKQQIKLFCHFSGDQKLLIMLFTLLISWSHLRLTHHSWDRKSLIMLFRLLIAWLKLGQHNFELFCHFLGDWSWNNDSISWSLLFSGDQKCFFNF